MSDTQSIKDRLDIVQFIQEYLPLKKAGANWKAPCPFHREKTPSFMVHPEKQIWHCFGCGKGGDVFTFFQEMEGLDFPEALKILAERAGVKLERSFENEAAKSQKNRILDINAKAAYFFNHFLTEMPAAQTARDYLFKKRGLSAKIVEEWQIGFIPEQWDLLTQYLLKKGNGIDDLVASGLTIKNEERKSHYDRFRGRIMFPIWDVHNNVVGFTGRQLVENAEAGGKYVNTPQTAVYDKSRVIYGLNKAKNEIKAKDLIVLVEGQMDVIACHQAGMTNVVAVSGTALTEEQIRLLKRYSSNIAVAFDSDAAGQAAAQRGVDLAIVGGLNVKVIAIPEGAGKDADECLKKNPKVWFKAVEEAADVMDWHFGRVLDKAELKTPKQKQAAVSELFNEILKIPFDSERDSWIKKLAERVGVDESALRGEAKRIKRGSGLKNKGTSDRPILPEGNRHDLLLERFWALVVKHPPIFSALRGSFEPRYFADTPFAALYEFCEKQYNNGGQISFASAPDLRLGQNEPLVDLLQMRGEAEYPEADLEWAKKEAGVILKDIKELYLKDESRILEIELKKAEEAKDKNKVDALLKQIMALK